MEKEKRACTTEVCNPRDFQPAEPDPHIPLLGGFGSGCQLGPGLIGRGPRDVFLKHCVNPNEFQVPYCPSSILFKCKNVGFSFVQNYYYKSLCPIAFSSSYRIYFLLDRFRISDVSLNLGQD